MAKRRRYTSYMTWEIEGQKQKMAFMDKIEGKLSDGRPLTGFERSLWRLETGLVDFVNGQDDGEERVIRYHE